MPNVAVKRGPDGLFAYVIDAQNKVSVRPIKVNHEGDTTSQVASGLTQGDRTVVAGQYRLTPGALVDPKEAIPPTPAQGSPSVAANENVGAAANSTSRQEK